tara:strand:- start:93 stop:1385 length:1293 start_codon:yes stop_codon:yes gene_type:complete
MKRNLEKLQSFVDQMKATSSILKKKVIIGSIKNDEFIKKALNYTYDPYKKYYVTSKNCIKNSSITSIVDTWNKEDLFYNLDTLNDRTATGHAAIRIVNTMTDAFPEYKDLIHCIVDRNLELRASDSVINKVIPNLIPTFDVALATKYEPRFCDFENEEWLGSRKLDGVRCIVRKEGTSINAYSRQGNTFTTLQKVLDDIIKIPGDFVLDGEICVMNEEGDEDFLGIMKQIKRKNHTMDNPKYVIFDYLTLEEFDTKEGIKKLEDRYINLQGYDFESTSTLSLLDQHLIESDKALSDMIDEAEHLGHEGIMLRKNSGYEGKRSKNLLKCKKFHEAEYVVVGVAFDNHRVIRDGKEVLVPMLAQAYIIHKGNPVAVGSGWSQAQRIKYEANPDLLIGKTITVRYFEETKNQEGGVSLRFPTVKHIFENGRNI